jgi:hypothetical protein
MARTKQDKIEENAKKAAAKLKLVKTKQDKTEQNAKKPDAKAKFEITEIVTRRKVANKDEYRLKVRWAGWVDPKSGKDFTWEPEENIVHLDIVKAYKAGRKYDPGVWSGSDSNSDSESEYSEECGLSTKPKIAKKKHTTKPKTMKNKQTTKRASMKKQVTRAKRKANNVTNERSSSKNLVNKKGEYCDLYLLHMCVCWCVLVYWCVCVCMSVCVCGVCVFNNYFYVVL